MPTSKQASFWELLLEAMDDFTVKMLMAAGTLSVVLSASSGATGASSSLEGWAILGTVLVVVLVTATTNREKEQKFQSLNILKDAVQVGRPHQSARDCAATPVAKRACARHPARGTRHARSPRAGSA